MKTLTELRGAFWRSFPQFSGLRRARKRQNAYPCNVRAAWVEFVDRMARSGEISNALANRATL